MVLIPIIILVAIVGILIFYNINIKNKLNTYSNISKKINNLNVLQDFMNITGEDISVDEKLERINEVLIEKFGIKYSTIVVFNGAEYVLKASNTEKKYWRNLTNLHTAEVFKDSINTAEPKYITVNQEGEQLPYQQLDFSRAKSAIFFPLYIDNVYIGYWIIESSVMHAFDNVDTTLLEVIKDDIVAMLKTVSYQNAMESIVRTDQFTGLNSAEYLYGQAKATIDSTPTSTVCMFRINNIEEINKTFSRETGNSTIIEIANWVKTSINSDDIFVRYMGPKFVIVFIGKSQDDIIEIVKTMRDELEQLEIQYDRKVGNKIVRKYAKPRVNFVISNYYKGTGIERVTEKLEEYLDNADKSEHNISFV
ncbi:MAG: diguanylate cyclase [Clostridia bacterium]|nr:diguanylate cyclase [Clostridia bacterium]